MPTKKWQFSQNLQYFLQILTKSAVFYCKNQEKQKIKTSFHQNFNTLTLKNR